MQRKAGVEHSSYLCSLSMHVFICIWHGDTLAAGARVISRVLKVTTREEKAVDTNHRDGRSCLFFFYIYIFTRSRCRNTPERCQSSRHFAVIALDVERNMKSFGIPINCRVLS